MEIVAQRVLQVFRVRRDNHKNCSGELLNFIAKTLAPQLRQPQLPNLICSKRKHQKQLVFWRSERNNKSIYNNHKYFSPLTLPRSSGGFRCAMVCGFLPGGIRPANAKLYNFYVWSLFRLLIAFPSLTFVRCVWESVKISLSQVKATSLLAILVIAPSSPTHCLRSLFGGLDPSLVRIGSELYL